MLTAEWGDEEEIHFEDAGGRNRRSLGRAGHVAAMMEKNPRLFGELMRGLWSEGALVRMRAADAAEK